MCYKQKCKVVSLNLAHPVHRPNRAPIWSQKQSEVITCSLDSQTAVLLVLLTVVNLCDLCYIVTCDVSVLHFFSILVHHI